MVGVADWVTCTSSLWETTVPFRLLGHPGQVQQPRGIVIDTRFNGGGRLHEDIEILFSGQKYFTQVVRGREACDMPSRRWNKPSIMVMCEANYSNAHGTPWVYSHRGIGKLVGMPVPGTMTSVSWERLQDPSLVFGIPRRRLSPAGRQLSGELATGAGHQSSQFARDHREGRRHTAESCRRGAAEGTQKISTALPHAGIPVI